MTAKLWLNSPPGGFSPDTCEQGPAAAGRLQSLGLNPPVGTEQEHLNGPASHHRVLSLLSLLRKSAVCQDKLVEH